MERLLAVLRRPGRRGWVLAGVLAAVLVGAALRLVWVADMEWKGDEAWTYEQTCQVHGWADLPGTGMSASVGIPNPGMSVWVFVGLSKLFGVREPTGLARAVQLVNVAALLLLVVFAYRFVPAAEREPWLWATALVAVNPLAVLMQRKIWPPSVLPLLTMLLLCAWQRRSSRPAAFFGGLVAMCMGQIHLSGFFLAAAFALWALLFDRRGVAWGAWLAGAAVGALPMIPWFGALAIARGQPVAWPPDWLNAVEGKFWLRWLEQAFGLGIDYALHGQFHDFLTYPHVLGRPTYLIGILHVVLAAAALLLLVRLCRSLWVGRRDLWTRFTAKDSPSAFTLNAALWGFGLLLTASCRPMHLHYLIILFPLPFLWVARLALGRRDAPAGAVFRGRVVLAVLWAAQLMISAQFLDYIHVNQGSSGGYGTTYAAQQVHHQR